MRNSRYHGSQSKKSLGEGIREDLKGTDGHFEKKILGIGRN